MNASLFADFVKSRLITTLKDTGTNIVNADPKDSLNLHRLHGHKDALTTVVNWIDTGLEQFLNTRPDGGTTLMAPPASEDTHAL